MVIHGLFDDLGVPPWQTRNLHGYGELRIAIQGWLQVVLSWDTMEMPLRPLEHPIFHRFSP